MNFSRITRSDLKALALIQKRNSASKLKAPGPGRAELVEIFKSALRAPDHGRLGPWRFIVIEGDDREELGRLFADALRVADPEASIEKCQGEAARPLRAPLIITVVARVDANAKVPAIEQLLSAGCAAQNILLSAEALGYAAIWRTGDMAYDKRVHRGLGLQENEAIVAFIYIGTRDGEAKALPEYAWDEFVRFGL